VGFLIQNVLIMLAVAIARLNVKSFFKCFISLDEMRQLHQKVKKLVKPEQDDVRFYWIPRDPPTPFSE
jgi:CRISPR/Cas system-associated endoribonuclease Cas2